VQSPLRCSCKAAPHGQRTRTGVIISCAEQLKVVSGTVAAHGRVREYPLPAVRLTPSRPAPWTGMIVPGGVSEMSVVRVLVVDDQAPFLRAMTSVVEETDGFEVVGQAESGEESLVVAAAVRPDLVLMDVNLPGIDGLEATRRLRAGDSPPVVLLLSTYDEDAGEVFVAESGAAAYVTKSAFGPDRLEHVWFTAVR
jgi:CheY-like chemotaxis protein